MLTTTIEQPHQTTILQDYRPDDGTRGYQAACACGWTGLRRLRMKIAARDCADHRSRVMPACCLASFCERGIADGFRVAPEGAAHTCATCGRGYRVIRNTWTRIAGPDA